MSAVDNGQSRPWFCNKYALERLGLVKYGRLTNGGDVLFATHSAMRHPQVRVRAVCYTSDKSDETHRDYADFRGRIAVHIYPNRLEIWNSGNLPEGISPDDLVKGHLSVLRNPDIAHILYLRGLMEELGRGCVMIRKACEEYGIPAPAWRADANTGVTLTFFAPEVTPEVTPEVNAVLTVLTTDAMTRRELQEKLSLKDAEHFRKHYLTPVLNGGFVEMTIPDKPQSRLQRYRLTQLGQHVLAMLGVA